MQISCRGWATKRRGSISPRLSQKNVPCSPFHACRDSQGNMKNLNHSSSASGICLLWQEARRSGEAVVEISASDRFFRGPVHYFSTVPLNQNMTPSIPPTKKKQTAKLVTVAAISFHPTIKWVRTVATAVGNRIKTRSFIFLANVRRQVSLAGGVSGSPVTGAKALGLLCSSQALCLSA